MGRGMQISRSIRYQLLGGGGLPEAKFAPAINSQGALVQLSRHTSTRSCSCLCSAASIPDLAGTAPGVAGVAGAASPGPPRSRGPPV